jgi:hypothetical protein
MFVVWLYSAGRIGDRSGVKGAKTCPDFKHVLMLGRCKARQFVWDARCGTGVELVWNRCGAGVEQVWDGAGGLQTSVLQIGVQY